jgi:hypothetical protein
MKNACLPANCEEANVAEYGIVVGIKDIKGKCQLSGYTDQLLAETVAFGSGARRTSVGGGIKNTRTSVDQSAVEIRMPAGKWTAELLQALYNVTDIGDVTVTQLGQAVDKAATAAPTVIQKLTLTKSVITALNQVWTAEDAPRVIVLTLEFDKILLEIDKKPADFTLHNVTAGAK